jgi:protein-tyrosine phosphatase
MSCAGLVALSALAIFSMSACAQTQSAARATERQVQLDGQPNFRDLGGYETADGQRVKWGQVYRSGELSRLTDADVERLHQDGIRTVINFLTPAETASRGDDRLPDGVQEISHPIETGDELVAVVLEARATGDFSTIPPELNVQIHMILPAEATSQYAAVLRAAADPANRPLVYHCSHGVHRTGTFTAILLWALGVPWETIRADYLLSNEYRREDVEQRLEQLRQLAAEHQRVPPEQVDMTNISAFYTLEPSYIDATRDWILAEFSSIDDYLREGLGLTEGEIRRLRVELLE